MATQSQSMPQAPQTVRTIVDVQIFFSDGTSEYVDMKAVKALSWYAAPINKTKPHAPGNKEPNIPSQGGPSGGATNTMTTMSASTTAASGTMDDEQRGTCWWDGQNWVCY